jgi:hypothetical protein
MCACTWRRTDRVIKEKGRHKRLFGIVNFCDIHNDNSLLASSIINDHEIGIPMGTVKNINIQSICRCMTEGHNADIIMLNCVTPILFF